MQFGISILSLQLFWNFVFSSVSAIWYLRSVSTKKIGVIFYLPLLQNLVFQLSFSFYNLVFLFCLCNCFGISSSLQFLQFGICIQFLQKTIGAIFYLPLLQNLVFRFSFSFYNLVFLLCLCNCFGIPSSLQFLQFDICVQFLQFYFGVIFCLPLLQNLVFRLSFSFCNLVFLLCLCNCFGISSSFQFLQFGICVQFLQFYFGVIFYLSLLQNLVFRLSFSFCNLVFLLCLCNCFGISSSLQFLQFGICVQFLQFYFGVIFCLSLLQNLVFRLSFSFYNLVFLLCFCNCFGISSSLQFLQFDICIQFLQFYFGVIFCLPLLQNLVF